MPSSEPGLEEAGRKLWFPSPSVPLLLPYVRVEPSTRLQAYATLHWSPPALHMDFYLLQDLPVTIA